LPTLTAQTFAAGLITVTIDPVPAASQTIHLYLNQTGAAGRKIVLEAEKRATDADPIQFKSTGVPGGTYLVRAEVDGVEGELDRDENPISPTYRQFLGPKVTI
jgi:hypothetical protein